VNAPKRLFFLPSVHEQHVFFKKNVGLVPLATEKINLNKQTTIGVFQHHTKDQKRNPRRLSVLLLALYF
jgi:hypothetical protein